MKLGGLGGCNFEAGGCFGLALKAAQTLFESTVVKEHY